MKVARRAFESCRTPPADPADLIPFVARTASWRASLSPQVVLHPDDEMLWDVVYPDRKPDGAVRDRDELEVAGERLRIVHTPGHSAGGVCRLGPDGHVFGGDTLFKGGPGATGRSYSDFPTIIESIRDRLLVLPADTVVHTGHGESTTIGAEAPHLDEWMARGS
jgi:glyoxylase-like metal-dependent hydrolase (beta-lactamase superfamily II)